MKQLCPCGSSNTYDTCCQPFHDNTTFPKTAEQLMRSRYSAYSKKLLNYLVDTHHPVYFDPASLKGMQETFSLCQWTRLTILNKKDGAAEDTSGIVEFKADYIENGESLSMTERSSFEKLDGRWMYLSIIN
jgi:SEC-C motif-containing protein